MHVILGGNGTGKTTLLRSVLGIQAVLSGSICLNDGETRWQRRARSLEKAHGLRGVHSASRSGVDCAGGARDVRRLGRGHGPSPCLKPWSKRPLSQLYKQQVMVARAMLQSQSWIVLDEPTAFLDVKGQSDLWAMLTQHLEHGGSVLMATHDLRGVLHWSQMHASLRSSGSLNILNAEDLENVGWAVEEEELVAKLTGSSSR